MLGLLIFCGPNKVNAALFELFLPVIVAVKVPPVTLILVNAKSCASSLLTLIV